MLALLHTFCTGPPIITSNIDASQPHWVMRGVPYILRCAVSEPNTPVAIYRNNFPLDVMPYDSNGDQSVDGAEIAIMDFPDSGWYTCTATNSFGRTDLDFLVIVGGEYTAVYVKVMYNYVCYVLLFENSAIN